MELKKYVEERMAESKGSGGGAAGAAAAGATVGFGGSKKD